MSGIMMLRKIVTVIIRSHVQPVNWKGEVNMTKLYQCIYCDATFSCRADLEEHNPPSCEAAQLFPPKPLRVEIWRYTKDILTFACTDGSAFNTADTFTKVKHNGYWNSRFIAFVPGGSESHFSDGTPVELYEGQEPEPVEAGWPI